jgi:hypothetical protein
MKLRGLVPNFYIHVSVSDLYYIPTIGPRQTIVEIYKKKPGVGNRRSATGLFPYYLAALVQNFACEGYL